MLFPTWNQESCPKHWLSCGCGGWEPLLQWFLESFRPPALSPFFSQFWAGGPKFVFWQVAFSFSFVRVSRPEPEARVTCS